MGAAESKSEFKTLDFSIQNFEFQKLQVVEKFFNFASTVLDWLSSIW